MSSPHDPINTSGDVFADLPDPGQARTLDDLVTRLRFLKVWAGDPSYGTITDRVNAAWDAAGRPAGELARKTTVVDCFRPGRRRVNADLVVAVVHALHPDEGYVSQWRQALRVVGGEARATSQVRVQDVLPEPLPGFTGRAAELERIRAVFGGGRPPGDAGVIFSIGGMAGVGKTQLALCAGHLLDREAPFDRVLFVDLRGFHPDPTQPPAEPGAVLDGFLRLLGMPGHQVPHDPHARSTAYRALLAGTRTLVVLDNAATSAQVGPLLPGAPGCVTLVTSRRSLTDLDPAARVAVDVFTLDEALAFLARSLPGVPVGTDPTAAARIARRCGCLPLALGLVAGHIRSKHGWTLTDHADRLDERHRDRRMETGVALALHVSYRHLPADLQRLLRLTALHPGQDIDAYAAAALTCTDPGTARTRLDQLQLDHLLQRTAAGRYACHDLVRAYARERATDDDPPPERRNALTRLFDHYLAVAAAAMDILAPAEASRRPRPPSTAVAVPTLTGPDAARDWLNAERANLVAVTGYTATQGWPSHTTRLSATLFRYLDSGYPAEALIVHGHARDAARASGDTAGEAHAMIAIGITEQLFGRYDQAVDQFHQALRLLVQVGDLVGQARSYGNLGAAELSRGDYPTAAEHCGHALSLYRQVGDVVGEARTLGNIGLVEERLGDVEAATRHYERALELYRQTGDDAGVAATHINLGIIEDSSGRHEAAAAHHEQGLALHRQIGHRPGEAWSLHCLGAHHTRIGEADRAIELHEQALEIFRETGERDGEPSTLNGLGEAAADGSPAAAVVHHTAAHVIAAEIGDRPEQARAHTGLGRAHCALGDLARARSHYQHAVQLYQELGVPEAELARARLAALRDTDVGPPS